MHHLPELRNGFAAPKLQRAASFASRPAPRSVSWPGALPLSPEVDAPSVAPGDVLIVRGSGRLTDIGVNGGFLGHAMLALSQPVAVPMGSVIATRLADVWPRGASRIWKVAAVECCRSAEGLQWSEVFLHVRRGELVLLGDLTASDDEPEGVIHEVEGQETVEVWHCPKELRSVFCTKTMTMVLDEMSAHEANWSLTTAVRAVFSSSWLGNDEPEELLQRAKAAWKAAPICTSVPIIFWQRYLCRMAKGNRASQSETLRKWLPLAADRALPGDLVSGMTCCGWTVA